MQEKKYIYNKREKFTVESLKMVKSLLKIIFHYITLYYITLQYITLHYIILHYMSFSRRFQRVQTQNNKN